MRSKVFVSNSNAEWPTTAGRQEQLDGPSIYTHTLAICNILCGPNIRLFAFYCLMFESQQKVHSHWLRGNIHRCALALMHIAR